MLASGSGWVVIEVGGLGVRAEVTAELALTARVGQELFLLTSLVVREDSLTLFGFAHGAELELFGHLIAVSGVGPRSALAVLSTLAPAVIVRAVKAEDEKPFTKVSGIGPKTAKLIVVSLHGKVEYLGSLEEAEPVAEMSEDAQIVLGLVGLGWPEADAEEAVAGARDSGAPTDPAGLLRAALVLLQAPRAGSRSRGAKR